MTFVATPARSGRRTGVTAPRQVIAGLTYLMTRRCTQRQFLLRPEPKVEQIYRYCLGEAVTRYHVTLHAFVAMSNHQHLIVRDNDGNFPAFLAHLNKMIAKALNAHWGRCENLWATEQPNAVHLVDADARFEKLVYVLANPVADFLVERVSDWPGASSLGLHLSGRAEIVKRPMGFFREEGSMPDEVTIELERIDGYQHLDAAEWSATVARAVQIEEEKARAARVQKNIRVLGRKAVLRAAPTDRPTTVEPPRALRPSVACRDPGRRAHALQELVAFRAAHRAAIRQRMTGDAAVEFPFGTYRARLFGAFCAKSRHRAA